MHNNGLSSKTGVHRRIFPVRDVRRIQYTGYVERTTEKTQCGQTGRQHTRQHGQIDGHTDRQTCPLPSFLLQAQNKQQTEISGTLFRNHYAMFTKFFSCYFLAISRSTNYPLKQRKVPSGSMAFSVSNVVTCNLS